MVKAVMREIKTVDDSGKNKNENDDGVESCPEATKKKFTGKSKKNEIQYEKTTKFKTVGKNVKIFVALLNKI